MSAERWVDIPGWAGAYRISDMGRVLSVARHCRTCNHFGVETSRRVPARIMRARYRSSGRHAHVELCREGQPQRIDVAVMVLEVFDRPRPRGHYAEHLNGDTTDCRLSNLRWEKQNWGGQGRKLKRHSNETAAA